jgi:hypothetical protein
MATGIPSMKAIDHQSLLVDNPPSIHMQETARENSAVRLEVDIGLALSRGQEGPSLAGQPLPSMGTF